MSSEGGDIKLSKFNGGKSENFQLWSVRCKAALKSKNVWPAVRPAEEEATSSAAATSGESAGGAEAVSTGAPVVLQWCSSGAPVPTVSAPPADSPTFDP